MRDRFQAQTGPYAPRGVCVALSGLYIGIDDWNALQSRKSRGKKMCLHLPAVCVLNVIAGIILLSRLISQKLILLCGFCTTHEIWQIPKERRTRAMSQIRFHGWLSDLRQSGDDIR